MPQVYVSKSQQSIPRSDIIVCMCLSRQPPFGRPSLHVPWEWVRSLVSVSRHTWMRHVTRECVISPFHRYPHYSACILPCIITTGNPPIMPPCMPPYPLLSAWHTNLLAPSPPLSLASLLSSLLVPRLHTTLHASLHPVVHRALHKHTHTHNKPLRESYVYVNESLAHICEWVMSYVRGSAASCRSCQLTHMKEYTLAYANYSRHTCHTCAWVTSHVWMSHVTHINASFHWYVNESRSCHSYVNESRSHASQSPGSHISHMNVFFHTYKWCS